MLYGRNGINTYAGRGWADIVAAHHTENVRMWRQNVKQHRASHSHRNIIVIYLNDKNDTHKKTAYEKRRFK